MDSINTEADSDPTERIFATAIQSAIERLLIEGTRHAVDLKGFDRAIERNAELLSQNPNNSTLQDDQTRRKKVRNESMKKIEELSSGIAIELQQKFKEIHPIQTRNGLDIGGPDSSSDHQPPSDLVNQLKIMHKRIGKHAHEVERIDCEHQVAIDALRQQVAAQEEVIGTLKKKTPAPSSNTSEQAPPQTSSNLESSRLKEDLKQMEIRISELKNYVKTILTEEIPVNLSESVKFMQDDLNHAFDQYFRIGHSQISDLIINHQLIQNFEPRLKSLENLINNLRNNNNNINSISVTDHRQPIRLIRRRNNNDNNNNNAVLPICAEEPSHENCTQQ
ncbi:hypothetical protein MJO28_010686 [Puccinia striiformis f. sp. tritici]|uniref:Uncharacterized protein n=1 Tax=Puccinia striiformis f. sp. tritici TaxID=168172 RepID=A0ACC0E6L8_9BASI|nr:hypothetical protein MJO28_010686 [Puccinia striiformis f. sp. tritici]